MPELLVQSKGLARTIQHCSLPQCWARRHPSSLSSTSVTLVWSVAGSGHRCWWLTSQVAQANAFLPQPQLPLLHPSNRFLPWHTINSVGGKARPDLNFYARGYTDYPYLHQPFSLYWNCGHQIPCHSVTPKTSCEGSSAWKGTQLFLSLLENPVTPNFGLLVLLTWVQFQAHGFLSEHCCTRSDIFSLTWPNHMCF